MKTSVILARQVERMRGKGEERRKGRNDGKAEGVEEIVEVR